jgi:serine/threonine protein phosphatase PrpC
MAAKVYGLTDVGRARQNNEDAFCVEPSLGLLVVADGVGGHNGGEVASQTACREIAAAVATGAETLRAAAADPSPANRQQVAQLLDAAIQAGCLAVFKKGQADPSLRGMATTVAAVLVFGQYAVVAHAGDSRVYLARQGGVYQLTEDHTLGTDAARRGDARRADTDADLGKANALTRAIGFQPSVPVDCLQLELADGDRLIACSDGLSNYLSRDDLALAVSKLTPEKLPQALVDLANKRGGADNITAVVLAVEGGPPAGQIDAIRKMEVLRGLPMFQQLSMKELAAVLNAIEVRAYQPGQPIIREGEEGDCLFVSVLGRVEVLKQGQTIAELEPGSCFGEMALIDRSLRSADVVAVETVRLLAMPREAFFGMIRREPATAIKLLWAISQSLNQRLRRTSDELSWLKSTMPRDIDPICFDEQ